MDAYFIYLLKAALCFTLFYLFVVTLLSRETFHRFNRYVLLIGMIGCLILPLVEINTQTSSIIQSPFIELEERIKPNVPLPTLTPIGEDIVTPIVNTSNVVDTNSFDLLHLALAIYIFGGVVNAFMLTRSVLAMFRLIKHGHKIRHKDYILVISDKKICPFSWRKYIVISQDDYDENSNEIIIHELAHIRHWHSLDITFVELILLFQWFNPVIWLLKREIQSLHEYQADRSVLESGIDATKYQLLLVKKAVGASSYTLANSFNHSKIKKRITMMLKEKSNNWAKLRLLLMLPVVTLSVYAFSRPEVNIASNDKFNEILQTEDVTEEKEASAVEEGTLTTQKESAKKIVGSWVLVTSNVNGKDIKISGKRYKTIRDGKFTWETQGDKPIASGASGTYTFDGETYTENIQVDLGGMAPFIGKKAVYKVSFNGEEMITEGLLEGQIAVKEVWRKIVRFTPPIITKDKDKKQNKLIGTWKLEADGVNQVKYINDREFSWVRFGVTEDSVTAGANGSYTFEGNTYTEHIEGNLGGMDSFIGQDAVYNVSFEGNKMIIEGTLAGKIKVKEVWTKVSPKVPTSVR